MDGTHGLLEHERCGQACRIPGRTSRGQCSGIRRHEPSSGRTRDKHVHVCMCVHMREPDACGHVVQVAIMHRWPCCTGGHIAQVFVRGLCDEDEKGHAQEDNPAPRRSRLDFSVAVAASAEHSKQSAHQLLTRMHTSVHAHACANATSVGWSTRRNRESGPLRL